MSKPADIPQDIWDIAYETLHPLVREQYEISPFSQVQHYGIARAILDERERCARVADEHGVAWGLAMGQQAHVIANAIRAPSA